ncbi:choice-of-anchor L domain-containing protein [Allohahella sp. A8]|uniref:choice-of-anchor L domain-containing protein n=1 Tax=Allohahella sp. A8 TaxID=3141461 RepID=UPI003A812A6A
MTLTLQSRRLQLLSCACVFSQTALAADITANLSREQITTALGIAPEQVISFTTNGTDPRAIGLADTSVLGIVETPKAGNDPSRLLTNGYPTEGRDFLIISTGAATDAALANDSDSTTTELDGLNVAAGTDLAQIDMVLRAPENAQCASFDFSFFSEEYNEFVGSPFNDTFIIEKDESTYTVESVGSGIQVNAPNNFAFDTSNNVISINSTFDTICGTNVTTPEDCATGTTYDNATIRLRASTPVIGGSDVRFIISIMDLSDSILDSAAFMDKFLWQTESCASGAQEIPDIDNDGLLDDWETNGLTVTLPDGSSEFLDLPAMGADPLVKDLFIELDWMVRQNLIDYRPSPEVLAKVIAAYDALGINVHIDAGPDSIMNPQTGQTWADAGMSSRGSAIDLVDTLGQAQGTNYDWNQFDGIKATQFSPARHNVFHYGIIGHGSPFKGVSAISRNNNSSDFFVPLADFLGTTNEQAGSILKATGMNLALREGGRDNLPNKPNYISVMNPLYTLDGTIRDGVDGHMFFSQVAQPALTEAALNETTPLLTSAEGAVFAVKHACNSNLFTIATGTDGGVDWNCDSLLGDAVAADIDLSGRPDGVLASYVDFTGMRFSGGLIGEPDSIITLPRFTPVTGYKQPTAVERIIPSLFEVSVVMPGSTAQGTFTQKAIIRNRGTTDDVFTVTGSSALGLADFSVLSGSYSIAGGKRVEIEFPIATPTNPAQTDEIRLVATSNTHSTISDTAVLYVSANGATGGPGATHAFELYEDGNPFRSGGGGSLDWLALIAVSLGFSARLIKGRTTRSISKGAAQ